jgi:long-chain fatty acid transport protein
MKGAVKAFLVAQCLAGTAHAGGFALIEQSASQMGHAFAGGSAIADDATTVYFNPAGLTEVPHQAVGAVHLVRTEAKFDGAGTALDGATPTTGGNGGDAGDTTPVPNLYYARPLNSKAAFGLGINVPFGLATEYDDDWKGRYLAVESHVVAINVNPSLAFKVNDSLSVGAGVSAQYIEARLSQQVDYGSICFSVAPAATCTGLGLLPQQADGLAKARANGLGAGFNLGLLFKPSDATRIGFAYRSQVKHEVRGRARFNNAPAAIVAASGGAFIASDLDVSIDLPESLSLSVYQKLGRDWALMADVTRTGWDSFDELRLEYDNAAQSDSTVDESWNDTTRYSAGANYRAGGKWLLRGGVAYDESPIPNDAHRTPRIPGEDRWWLSVGCRYSVNPRLSVDVGYSHLFVDEPSMNHTDENGLRIVGDYDAQVDILSAQLNWNI